MEIIPNILLILLAFQQDIICETWTSMVQLISLRSQGFELDFQKEYINKMTIILISRKKYG